MLDVKDYEKIMRIAIEEAKLAYNRGDVPVGAVLVDNSGNVLVRSGNMQRTENNPTSHAEIVLIREATRKLGTDNLEEYSLFSTAEPCPMCASALLMVKIKKMYIGARLENDFYPNIKIKEITKLLDDESILLVEGILEEECTEILKKIK